MWLRRLLVALYGLEERSAFTPDELDWEALPQRCVLQFHWHRTPEFLALLDRYDCAVVVLARHPLDVLVSILHFAQHEPATDRWLDGEAGSEAVLRGADPTSRAFVEYAKSPRARALLSVTPEWWERANARVGYESLVGDPAAELGRIAAALGTPTVASPAEAIESVRFERLQQEAPNHHFWQGRVGLWQELVPTAVALEIAEAYPGMRRFGYTVGVDDPTAAGRWRAAAVPVDRQLAQAS
jgi:hypothetical protein